MCKEDILPGLGHDYYLILTRNEGGKKYSYYVGFSKDAGPDVIEEYTAGVTVEPVRYATRGAADLAVKILNQHYKNCGIYIYGET